MSKRIAKTTNDLYSIAMIDREMIPCNPTIVRRNYVALVLRAIADSVETGDVVSIENIQWNGYGSLSGSLEFNEIGIEPFEYDLR